VHFKRTCRRRMMKKDIPRLLSDENFERTDSSRRSLGFVRPVQFSTHASCLLYSRTFKFCLLSRFAVHSLKGKPLFDKKTPSVYPQNGVKIPPDLTCYMACKGQVRGGPLGWFNSIDLSFDKPVPEPTIWSFQNRL